MPRQKKTADGDTSTKKRKSTRKAPIHPALKHLEGACVSVDDDTQGQEESELGRGTGARFMLYRVGPKSVCQGRRLYLHTFHYSPSLEEIRELFGGGEFWIQIYENGAYSKGRPRIVIEGDPKVLKGDSPEKVLDALPVSPDPVVNVLMQTIVQFMDRMAEEIKELKGVAPASVGLNPEKIRELMNAATEAQLTNRLVLMATGAGEASAADTEAVAERRFKTMLDMFKMGIETGREGDSGDGVGGLLNRFAPLLEKLMSSPAVAGAPATPAQVMPVEQGGGPSSPSAPVLNVSGKSDTLATEENRERFERETQGLKTQMLVERLQKGVSDMLDALESDVEYSNSQICGFILATVPKGELAHVQEHLTFDSIRILAQSNPQDQIALDGNRDRVEAVLAELVDILKTE